MRDGARQTAAFFAKAEIQLNQATGSSIVPV
jgi:hypothetical protein